VAGTLVNIASLRRQGNKADEALRLLEEAVPHHLAALKANPRHPVYRSFFASNRYNVSLIFLDLLDHAATVKMAEDWIKAVVEPKDDAYNAACFVALSIPLAQEDNKLTEMDRKKLAQDYANRAMAFLRSAFANGYRDATHMAEDDDLIPLRQRADFQALLKEMEKAKSAGDKGQ
jgi:hypothetical protein